MSLDIRWHDGLLEWDDPQIGRHIITLDGERAVRVHAETRAVVAEARAHELEDEARRLRGK